MCVHKCLSQAMCLSVLCMRDACMCSLYEFVPLTFACKPIHKGGFAPLIRSITGLDEGDVKSKRPYMRSACCIT